MGGAWAELDGGAAECGAVRRAIYWSGSQKPLESCSDSSHPVGMYRAEPTIPQSVSCDIDYIYFCFEAHLRTSADFAVPRIAGSFLIICETRPVLYSPPDERADRARSRGESHIAAARV